MSNKEILICNVNYALKPNRNENHLQHALHMHNLFLGLRVDTSKYSGSQVIRLGILKLLQGFRINFQLIPPRFLGRWS